MLHVTAVAGEPVEVQLRVKCGDKSLAARSREITDTGATDLQNGGNGHGI